ncbi:hypothetical protein [Qipengyuania atrilutea]|uniref:Uncharacterized protein n=1 Tax=Qipengyuania atrilutea TaxID=2744473 RepID=A0A850H077_9SPHN|nr:hypothetical protein [Actirhodobacter atriluteus]NVD45334.1 hypothetical protein [Actirhodobacter atriluteus]
MTVEAQMQSYGPLPADDVFSYAQAITQTLIEAAIEELVTIEFSSGARAQNLHFVFDLHCTGPILQDLGLIISSALSHRGTFLSRRLKEVDRSNRVSAVVIRVQNLPELRIERDDIDVF